MRLLLLLVFFVAFYTNGVFSYRYPLRYTTNKLKCRISNELSAKKPLSSADSLSDDEGYPPIGSLIRQGPVPFFIRLAQPDTYEQAVLKYMKLEKCDRKTAQVDFPVEILLDAPHTA